MSHGGRYSGVVVGTHSQGGGGGSTLLTTLTLQNTSGSSTGTNFIAPMFGHVFTQGDIASGTYPVLDIAGVNLPFTLTPYSTWPDGSMKHAGFMPAVIPNNIAGSGSLTINIKNGGTVPISSGRSISDITSQNFNMVLDGIENLTGSWTSTLNTGISDNDDHHIIASGPGGIIGRTRQQFMSGGAGTEHHQLECYWYWQILQTTAGALGGFRILPQVCQPWYNIDSPAKLMRGFDATVKNSSSTIFTPSNGSGKTATFTNGNPQIACTAHGLQQAMAVRLTGSPPSPFSTGVTYYVRVSDANNYQLDDTASHAIGGGGEITPTASGSCTVTPHIEVAHFGGVWGANTDGTWLRLNSSGAIVAEATVRWVFNSVYWRSTRLIPPYDLTLTGIPEPTSVDYQPNGRGYLKSDWGDTGPADGIGPLPGWASNHLIKQTALGERGNRVSALNMNCCTVLVKSSTTMTIPTVNNGSNDAGTAYTGMGSPNPSFIWDGGNASGFTAPSAPLGANMIWSSSHAESGLYYAYLITGEPQFVDQMPAFGNIGVSCRNATVPNQQRAPNVSSVQYYGCTFRDTFQPRSDAWGFREVALAAAILPDAYWECSDVKTYMNKLTDSALASINAYNAAQSAFWQNSGLYIHRTESGSAATGAMWQLGYLTCAVALAYAVTGKSAALTFLNHLVKFPAAVENDVGLEYMALILHRQRVGGDSSTDPVISAMNQIYYAPRFNAFSVDTPTGLFTASNSDGDDKITLTLNDTMMWIEGTGPTGLSPHTVYYLVSVTDPGVISSKTFKLATTPSGTPITGITLVGGGGNPVWRMAVVPSGSWGYSYKGTDTYTDIMLGSLAFAQAVGATLQAGLLTRATSIAGNMSINWQLGSSDAKWHYSSTF